MFSFTIFISKVVTQYWPETWTVISHLFLNRLLWNWVFGIACIISGCSQFLGAKCLVLQVLFQRLWSKSVQVRLHIPTIISFISSHLQCKLHVLSNISVTKMVSYLLISDWFVSCYESGMFWIRYGLVSAQHGLEESRPSLLFMAWITKSLAYSRLRSSRTIYA